MSKPVLLPFLLSEGAGKNTIARLRRTSPALAEAHILERLAANERRTLSLPIVVSRLASVEQFGVVLTKDNRFKQGTASLAIGPAAETITITAKESDGLAHAVQIVDPAVGGASLSKTVAVASNGTRTIAVSLATSVNSGTSAIGPAAETITLTGKDGRAHIVEYLNPGAAGRSLSKSVAVGATGIRTISVNLATTQHALTTALGSGAETIVSTGKDGLAHSLAFVDPSAAGASLSKTVAVGATGIRTIAVNLATTQHALSIAIGPAAETIVVTGKDGKAHTVEIAAGGALSTSVTFGGGGVAAIVVTKNNGVSTVAQVLAELNSGTAGTLVSAALGTAGGGEVAQTVAGAPLAGGGAISSTVAQVLAELNRDNSGEVINVALGTANGAETCVAVGAASLTGGGVLSSTVSQVVTELNKDDSGEVLTAALGTANGAEVAVALAAAPLSGAAITSTVSQVVTELNKDDSGEVITAALGTANGAEVAVAVGSTPLSAGDATATATDVKEFALAIDASTVTRARTIVSSCTGADNSTMQVTNGATAAAITAALDIDQADNNTVKTMTISGAGALTAATRIKGTLTAAAQAVVTATLIVELARKAGVGSYVFTIGSLDRQVKILGVKVAVDTCDVDNVTLDLTAGGVAAITQLDIDIADAGTVMSAVLTDTVTLGTAGGAIIGTLGVPDGGTVNLVVHVDYAVLGTGLETLSN